MSDELERKRQEKIASFKLNIESTEDYSDTLTQTPVSAQTEEPDGLPSEVSELAPAAEVVGQSVGMLAEQELNSFSSRQESGTKFVDKKSMRAAKKADRKRRRKKARKNRIIFRLVWIAMVLFVSVMIGEFLMVGVHDLLGVGREDEASVTITIPENADLDTITDILYDNHVINTKWFFKLYATLTKSTSGFTQGTFDIQTNKDYQALINYLQSERNRTDVVKLRFTEGSTLKDYAAKLEKARVCSAAEFLEACNSDRFDEYDFIKAIPNECNPDTTDHDIHKRYYKLEGYLFPDTYDFYVGEDVDSVIEKFLTNYRRKVYGIKSRAAGFEKKVTVAERAEAINMSMEDVLTLASLIQAEAANREDMYMVSAILHNRLATLSSDGMNSNGEGGLAKLQLDSTRYYPYTSLDEIPKKERATFKSRYFTYEIDGLPAGPICNPSLEAIHAALTVGETDYYYFCHKVATADEPAVAYYAKTMSEHEQNLIRAGLKPGTVEEESSASEE